MSENHRLLKLTFSFGNEAESGRARSGERGRFSKMSHLKVCERSVLLSEALHCMNENHSSTR